MPHGQGGQSQRPAQGDHEHHHREQWPPDLPKGDDKEHGHTDQSDDRRQDGIVLYGDHLIVTQGIAACNSRMDIGKVALHLGDMGPQRLQRLCVFDEAVTRGTVIHQDK